MSYLLEIRDVAKTFGPIVALKSMSLQVRPGEVHALIGENGAGKSTLMKILTGLYTPTSGSITLRGEAYAPHDPRDAAERGLSIVFQELSLCRNLSVAANVFANHEPSRFGFIRRRDLEKRARELIAELGLPVRADARVGDLSIAQQQLVEIAKGLSRPADVLILDEPTSSLSENEVELLFAIIERLKARGTSVIYISHRLEEIMTISDAITVIRDGEFVTTMATCEATVDDLIALMVGRPLQEIYPPRTVPAPGTEVAPVLEVEKLSSPERFHDVDLAIRPGEIVGLFGLVGAGRTEVMKALFGIYPSSGTIRLDGKAVRMRSPADAIAARIGFATENRKEEGLVLAHSVERNINMVTLGNLSDALGFARSRAERRQADIEVQRFGVKTNSISTVVGTLSGGNQQKVVLAKWLALNPRVLILDEPTRGVDVGAKAEIYRIIRELAAQGTAILMVSSELPEVLGLSDRVVVMHEGRVTATLPAEGLKPETVMTFAAGME
ncbi:sugar ABC transporter ATP-binding protein [Consotaella aegiceratis]|uniref:sugar ABC transporter ATP-binding protein n=1 Tax=Consotaella aegiceratis TaxID=3097961 RepID=UPI002F3EE20A